MRENIKRSESLIWFCKIHSDGCLSTVLRELSCFSPIKMNIDSSQLVRHRPKYLWDSLAVKLPEQIDIP